MTFLLTPKGSKVVSRLPTAEGSRVQAGEVTYELHSLGWKAFQQLCVAVAAQVWGQTIQSFFDLNDGGRDGAFHGTWAPHAGASYEGSFTVQCKFTSQPTKLLKLSDLKDELKKGARLAAKGLSDNYFLFTNARLTGANEEKIKDAFEKVSGLNCFAAFGPERISQMIRESARLRMLVPRVYGLGDLSQILDERAYAQGREILSALGDDLAKFVITDAYGRGAKALAEHGFVMLLGEPACGKSTIAAALALGALDEWGCPTLKIRDADDFVRHSNPHEPKQFFWIDDAFGATQLDWQATIDWNRVFPYIQAAIRRGGKVVFTSRDYIYRVALRFLKQSALPVLRDSQVVIHVEQITKEEREQILYNHIRLGTQSTEFKSLLKQFLPMVSAHQRFSPEIARRLGDPAFTKQLGVSRWELDQFVEKPMEFLKEIIQTLDANSRSAIALVFMCGGILPSPVTLTPQEGRAIELLGGSTAEVRNSLDALNGSLLIQVQEGGSFSWRFKHPTIRDAFAALVAENRELMDIYLAGTPARQLFTEISCGEVGVQGVKVIVPDDRYDTLLSRIDEIVADNRESTDPVNRFLASRCERNFLARFISRNPGFVPALHVWSYLYRVSNVDVIVRLNELGLLPEPDRLRHVAKIQQLAVETPDSGFLREDVKTLFTAAEFDAILSDVRTLLLPALPKCVDSWRDNHDGEDDPANYFSDLQSALKEYQDTFSEDAQAVSCINMGLAEIDKAIEEMQSEMPGERDSDDYYRGITPSSESQDSRSIFDDVDH